MLFICIIKHVILDLDASISEFLLILFLPFLYIYYNRDKLKYSNRQAAVTAKKQHQDPVFRRCRINKKYWSQQYHSSDYKSNCSNENNYLIESGIHVFFLLNNKTENKKPLIPICGPGADSGRACWAKHKRYFSKSCSYCQHLCAKKVNLRQVCTFLSFL